jgi:hypothetical protein
MARGHAYVAECGLVDFGLWMQLYKCSKKAVLMFALRICCAQVLGSQVRYVAPNGNEQNFDAKIYQHAIKWQNEAMRLKQYCCMLVVVSDIKKSKGQVQDQGWYQIGSRRQEVQCLHEGQQ